MKKKALTISNIDFSEDDWEQRFEIEHDNTSPNCLYFRIVDKHRDDDAVTFERTITLRYNEMRALGKALVFAADYVEQLYKEEL